MVCFDWCNGLPFNMVCTMISQKAMHSHAGTAIDAFFGLGNAIRIGALERKGDAILGGMQSYYEAEAG